MPARGIWPVAVIFIIAIAASLLAAWYSRQATRRSLNFWGVESVSLISNAPVTAVSFDGASPALQRGHIDRVDFPGARSKDADAAKGMLNIRRALLQDSMYRWDTVRSGTVAPREDVTWRYALRFQRDGRHTTVLFDFEKGVVLAAESAASVRLDPDANRELAEFFQEQFDEHRDEALGVPSSPGP